MSDEMNPIDEQEGGVAEIEKEKEKVEEPPQYKVVMFNDDYTPMDFVVLVLLNVFHKSETESVNTMLKIQERGSGVVGIYSREIAETKVAQVKREAEPQDYPLHLEFEPN